MSSPQQPGEGKDFHPTLLSKNSIIKSEGITQNQNTATLQELQNKIHKLANIEQQLSASVSTIEDLTIDEIIADQIQNSSDSESEKDEKPHIIPDEQKNCIGKIRTF